MANYVRRRSSDTRKQRQSVRRTRSTKNVNSVYGVANTRRRKVREQFRESARNRARGLNETSLKAMSRRNNQMRIPPSSVKMYNQLSAFPPDIPQPNINYDIWCGDEVVASGNTETDPWPTQIISDCLKVNNAYGVHYYN